MQKTIMRAVSVPAFFFAAAGMLQAAVLPTTTTLRGAALANVQPNPSGPSVIDQDTGTTGSFSVLAHDDDTATDAAGTLLSDVAISGSGNVAADGASGSAEFHGVWTATNTKPVGSANQGGTFSMGMRFFYSFLLDAPATLSIDVTTALGGSGNTLVGIPAMSVNHAISFDNVSFTDIALNGLTHVEYDMLPGFHQFQIDHIPNAGLSPWPNVTMTFDSNISFSIIPEPATATLALGAAACLLLRRRRRAE